MRRRTLKQVELLGSLTWARTVSLGEHLPSQLCSKSSQKRAASKRFAENAGNVLKMDGCNGASWAFGQRVIKCQGPDPD